MSVSPETRLFASFAAAAHAYVDRESQPIEIDDDTLVSSSQAFYLMTIDSLERPGLTAIAEALSVTKPSASQALGRLERRGFVTRQKGAGDARSVIFGLTPEGRHVCATLGAQHRRLVGAFRRLLESADPGDVERFRQFLDELARVLAGPARRSGPSHP